MRYAELDETQAGIKIAGRNINNLRYADGTTLMAGTQAATPPGPPEASLERAFSLSFPKPE